MATKICSNGHHYNPNIYLDGCPFCPNNNYDFQSIEEDEQIIHVLSEEDWERTTKIVYEFLSMCGCYKIVISLKRITTPIRKREVEAVYEIDFCDTDFENLKMTLSEMYIYKRNWLVCNDGFTCGPVERLSLYDNDVCLFSGQSTYGLDEGDLHIPTNFSVLLVKKLSIDVQSDFIH